MEIMPVIQWLQHHAVVAMTALFVVIVVLTYRPRDKSKIERYGSLPLGDDR